VSDHDTGVRTKSLPIDSVDHPGQSTSARCVSGSSHTLEPGAPSRSGSIVGGSVTCASESTRSTAFAGSCQMGVDETLVSLISVSSRPSVIVDATSMCPTSRTTAGCAGAPRPAETGPAVTTAAAAIAAMAQSAAARSDRE